VFKNRNNQLILQFFGVYIIVYLSNLTGLALFDFFEINIYLGGAILMIPMGMLSYKLNKTFVFKKVT